MQESCFLGCKQELTPVPQTFGIASASTLRVERFGVSYDRHPFFPGTRVPVEVFAQKEYRMDRDRSLHLAHLFLEVGLRAFATASWPQQDAPYEPPNQSNSPHQWQQDETCNDDPDAVPFISLNI